MPAKPITETYLESLQKITLTIAKQPRTIPI